MPRRRFRPFLRRCVATAALGAVLAPAPLFAGSVELVPGRPLDFGAMVVFGSGTKQITPEGVVSADGLITVPGAREGPAEFTLRYRPDGRTKSALIMLTLAGAGPQSQRGTSGTLSDLASDLPGIGVLGQGASRTLRLPVCSAPVCDIPFRIGGRLTLSGGASAATFSFPLQVTVRLLAETAG